MRTPQTMSRIDLVTFAFSYFAVGVTVSVALVERGTPTDVIIGAAFIVHSATAELAYTAVRDSGGSQWAAIISGWMVATRFGLLAAALRTKLRTGTPELVAAAHCSIDPNVAVALAQDTPERARTAFWFNTLGLFGGWVIGSIVGVFVGNVVENIEVYGLDVVLPAALLSILGPSLRQLDGRTAAGIGAVTCAVLLPFAPGGVPIMVSVVGALIAAYFVVPTKVAS